MQCSCSGPSIFPHSTATTLWQWISPPPHKRALARGWWQRPQGIGQWQWNICQDKFDPFRPDHAGLTLTLLPRGVNVNSSTQGFPEAHCISFTYIIAEKIQCSGWICPRSPIKGVHKNAPIVHNNDFNKCTLAGIQLYLRAFIYLLDFT